VLLFSATRRLFNLSRFVTVGVLRLLGIRRARAAPLAAYWWAAVMPDAALARRYLHPAADAAPADPPA
jgi:hypothetical protein